MSIVLPDVSCLEDFVVKQVRPEVVDDSIEGQAIPEAVAQVVDVDIVILGSHLGAPYLQRSQALLLYWCHDLVVNHLKN